MDSKIKFICLTLLAIFSLNAHAALIPTANTITVGNRVFTDLNSIIILTAHVSSAGGYSTFRLSSSSSGYKVTTGKTLHIYACKSVSGTQSAGFNDLNLGYGTTDSGVNGSAPTGATDLNNFIWESPNSFGGSLEATGDWQIPSADYAYVKGAGAQQVNFICYGYEQ